MYTIRFCRDHLSGSRGRVSVLKNAPCQVLQRTRFDSEECSLSSVLNFTPSYLQEVILHIYRRYKLLCTQSVFVVTIFPTVEDTFRFYKLLLVICYNFTPPHIQEVQVAIYTIRFFVVTIFPTVEDAFWFFNSLLVMCDNVTPPYLEEVQVAMYTIRFFVVTIFPTVEDAFRF